jgi:hypothetical protein
VRGRAEERGRADRCIIVLTLGKIHATAGRENRENWSESRLHGAVPFHSSRSLSGKGKAREGKVFRADLPMLRDSSRCFLLSHLHLQVRHAILCHDMQCHPPLPLPLPLPSPGCTADRARSEQACEVQDLTRESTFDDDHVPQPAICRANPILETRNLTAAVLLSKIQYFLSARSCPMRSGTRFHLLIHK